MTDDSDIRGQVEELESQLGRVSWSLLLLIGLLFGFALLLDVSVQLGIPRLCKIFDEMLPGEPLPALTAMVIQGRGLSFGIDFVLLAGVVVLFATRRAPMLVPIGTVATVVLISKAMLSSFALMMPLLRLLDKVGG